MIITQRVVEENGKYGVLGQVAQLPEPMGQQKEGMTGNFQMKDGQNILQQVVGKRRPESPGGHVEDDPGPDNGRNPPQEGM